MKEEATGFFRLSQWEDALERYQAALRKLPPRDGGSRENSSEEEGRIQEDASCDSAIGEHAKARAILNGNIGACYAKLVRIILQQ